MSSLPGASPAASSALPAAQSAPEKLRGTCQREKIGAGKKADAGGLTPAKDNDAASVDFGRWQACCPLSTEGRERYAIFSREGGLPAMKSRLLVSAVGVPLILVVILWAPVWVLAATLAAPF